MIRRLFTDIAAIYDRMNHVLSLGLDRRWRRLAAADVKNVSLTNFDIIAEEAAKEGYIRPEDVSRLIRFRNDPADESWRD